ncbi:MAG: LysE family transporter [Verrucomicrobia bacterium]|nr:LysE family transporter [Verrucomicrobiota bacterium]
MHDYWVEFTQVALAHLLAVASPGPDFAIVLRQSITHGRRTAIWTSLGIGTGILLHIVYSLLGIGLLIRSSPLWFGVVKYLGAAYVAWLGVQSLRARPRDVTAAVGDNGAATPSVHGAFATGFLTNALNPKATLFFLSLFVLLVNPQTPKLIQAAYGLWMTVATAGWFTLVSVFFTRDAVRAGFLRHGHWIDRALGVVFLGFAASLVMGSL